MKPKSPAPPREKRAAPPPKLDKYDLYELCVQSPDYDVRMLAAVYAYMNGAGRKRKKDPLIFGDDFCGPAALARAWVDIDPSRRAAFAVDLDGTMVEEAMSRVARTLPGDPRRNDKPRPRVKFEKRDVRHARSRIDLLAALNYSIGEFHERADLLAYFRRARQRLLPGGVVVCDMYGGRDAIEKGTYERAVAGPGGIRIRYEWEQRDADALTGMVENAIHFTMTHAEWKRARRVRNAFTYNWRLWSLPEIREAMREAGFGKTEVFPRHAEALDDRGAFHALPYRDGGELPESWSCYVAGR